MCQLLGMSCNVPTDIRFSFSGFQRRGGHTAQHADGWGIAFFAGRRFRLYRDPAPAVESLVADWVRSAPIRSTYVVAHIRKATRGPVGIENTHPFQRELWGRHWIFAHNGDLEGFAPVVQGRHQPVGTTDSELAFCTILGGLEAAFSALPPLPLLVERLASLSGEIARHGPFNYLLSNGDFLLAHCADRLSYVERKAPFGTAHLVDEDVTVDFRALTTPEDRVAVIATEPLTDDETWTSLAPGELAVFRDGARAAPARADAGRPFATSGIW